MEGDDLHFIPFEVLFGHEILEGADSRQNVKIHLRQFFPQVGTDAEQTGISRCQYDDGTGLIIFRDVIDNRFQTSVDAEGFFVELGEIFQISSAADENVGFFNDAFGAGAEVIGIPGADPGDTGFIGHLFSTPLTGLRRLRPGLRGRCRRRRAWCRKRSLRRYKRYSGR